MDKYLISLDQGTTSSRSIIFNQHGKIINKAQIETKQIYPKPGWVEQDPMEILNNQITTLKNVITQSSISIDQIYAIGITNQRETIVLWDKNTGKPIYNAIIWQCRRSSDICDYYKNVGVEDMITDKTGLIIDPYFSATKIKWLLDNVEGAFLKARNGDILAGTIDSWLIWNLTKGKCHITDYTNASRTLLFNIKKLNWDDELLKLFNIPINILPEVKPSSEIYGYVDKSFLSKEIPIASAAGDQQAALFGQMCFNEGDLKNTYGTGCFMLMNTGDKIIKSKNKLLTTVACSTKKHIQYALEGSVFVAGAAIQWLRDEMKLINSAEETVQFARAVKDTNGVYMVPAFVGLGAPYWDPNATGIIIGITRGTKKEHIIRAALESIAYQTNDIIKAIEEDFNGKISELRVDGGASINEFLMQFQADIINKKVLRPKVLETTALGAAYLAGMAVGIYESEEDIKNNCNDFAVYYPDMDDCIRDKKQKSWSRAVERSMKW